MLVGEGTDLGVVGGVFFEGEIGRGGEEKALQSGEELIIDN